MSLNSDFLDAFYACAQLRSFTQAAQRLHITQSALSQRINHLEEELGTTLFVRERGGIRLTEFGETLVRYCQSRELAESELLGQVENPKGKEIVGIVRIGAFSTVVRSLVLPTLSPLIKSNPKLRFKVLVREVYELQSLLSSGEVDFLITTEPMQKQGLKTVSLGWEENVLVQKRGYQGPDVYLDHDEEDQTTIKYLKKRPGQFQRSYLDDVYGILDGVRMGWGRAVLPSHLITQFSDLETVNPSKKLRVPIYLHYYDQPIPLRLHQMVVTCLQKLLGDAPRK